MATPIMTAEMKYITVNPTWNVPPSIVTREYMPALAQDPTVLARMGLRVSYNPDGSIHISQPPGDHNALGRLRFNFPQQIPGLSARHAGQEPVCAQQARVQPWLHARARSGEIRRGVAQHRAAR